VSQNSDLQLQFEGEFRAKLFGGLGLLPFPEVPWALSFNTGEIARCDLIHDQFPAEAISPFESTGRSIIAGRCVTQKAGFEPQYNG
jgi:hypothetical protein